MKYTKLAGFFIGLVGIAIINVQATPNATLSDFQARGVNYNGTGNAYPYRLFVPDGYNLPENAGRQYPLVLFMHGLGEGPNPSDNSTQVTGAGAPVLGLVTGANRDSFPAFILCPQIVCVQGAPNRTEWTWGDSTSGTPYNTKRIIDLLRNEFRIDANKISATGLSLGAMGTWAQLQIFPNYYAAGMPMSWNNVISNTGSAAIFAQTSLWVFYGDQDGYRYSNWNDPATDVNATRAAGGYVVFSRYPDGTHGTNTWGTAGNTRGFYTQGLMQWLTGQQKGVANTTQAPFLLFATPTTGSTYSTSSTALNLTGTASDAMGGGASRTISGLTWTNDRGGTGPATGTTSWLANGIVLQSGVNKVQLLATDNQSTTFNRLLTVTQAGAPTNQAPVVNAGVDKTVTLPASVSLSGSVTDDGVAPGSTTPTAAWTPVSGPGTVTFTPANAATTSAAFSVAGTYVLRLTGSDGVLSTTDDVNVTVNAASSGSSSIRFDFGGIATNGGALTTGNWNNVTDVSTTGVKVTNAINASGASTGIGLNITALFSNINYNGSTSTTGLYPATAMQDSFYVQDTQIAKVKLQGLTPGTPYTLVFFGSRMGTGTNRVTSYKVGTTAVTLDATDNATNSATLSNLLPAADGTIEVEVKNNSGAGYGYLGVLEVQVASAPLKFDFGGIATNGGALTTGNWNNVTDVSTLGVKITNAIDGNGVATGIGLNVTALFNNINYTGSTSTTGVYPASAMQDSFYVQDAQVGKVKLQGLNPARTYTLTFFGSRLGTGTNRVTSYKVGATAVTLDATDNSMNKVSLVNLAPAADGTIEVEVKNNTGTGYGYLGVLEVQP